MAQPTNIPWTCSMQEDSANILGGRGTYPGAGGDVIPFIAAQALNSGDAVSLTATAATVDKTITPITSGPKSVGIVVGGAALAPGNSSQSGFPTAMDVVDSDDLTTPTGILCANTGQAVFVQTYGVAYAVAGAAIVAGSQVGFDTGTAGRLIVNAAATQIFGLAITAAAGAGSVFKVYIRQA